MQCHDAKKNDTCAIPTARLGEQQIWLVTAISCSAQCQLLMLGDDMTSLEAFAGQSAGQPDPALAVGPWRVEGQTRSPEVPSN